MLTMSSYRIYRKLSQANRQDVALTVWQLRHYWHFCRNCPGWPDVEFTRWRFAQPRDDLIPCQACVGLVRMGVCAEPDSVQSHDG